MNFLSYLINGISLGSVYAIIALGYTMVYGIAKMLNFAHGDVIMIGCYVVFLAMSGQGISPLPAVVLSIIVCTVLGIVVEKIAYKPLRRATPLAVLITAIGVSYFLQNAALLLFGADTKSFSSVVSLPSLKLADGALTISGTTIVTVLACVVIMIALMMFIKKTKAGQAMLAVSEDKDAAQLMGVNVNATISLTFAIGSGLAAIAGVLFCSAYPTLTPYTGSMPGIKAFTAAVFGGIGSIPGALIGGILLGIIEILGRAYISSQLSDAIVLAKLNLKTVNKKTKDQLITFVLVIAVYIVVQIMVAAGAISSLMQGLLVPMCTYSIVAIGLNLCVGYLGELSIGHAGFMCVGAFSSAFCTKMLEGVIGSQIVLFIIALLVGTAMAAFFGFLIGIPVLRLRGDYLAIVTLAFGEIIKNIINVLYIAKDGSGFHFAISNGNAIDLADDGVWLINGAKGIAKIPHLSSFTAGVILILISLFVVYNLVNSRSGRAIMAIRDNRIAAESVGINITKFKLMAFTISAAIAGAGGVLYAHNLSTVTATPANFGYNMSIMILVFVVLGGMGNFRGSIIAAVLLTLLPEVLRGLSDYRMLIYSIVLIVMMLFNWAPKCIEWRQKMAQKFRKNTKKEAV